MKKFICLLSLAAAPLAFADCEFREDTGSQAFLVGPFLDGTDGISAETALTVANTDIRVSKEGGNTVAKNSGGCTHDEAGMYLCTFDATDTNTAGNLQIYTDNNVDSQSIVPVWHECSVLSTGEYDRKYGVVAQLTSTMAGLNWSTTITTVTSQTELILTDGPSNNDALLTGSKVLFVGGTERCEATVSDYVGSTTTLHLESACAAMTLAASDEVYVYVGPSGQAVQAARDAIGNLNDFDPASQEVDVGAALDGLVLQSTTIATLASQTSFTLTAGSADDDAYNGRRVVIVDQATTTQVAVGRVFDYTGSSKTVTLAFDPGVFTVATGDSIHILAD